MKCTVLWDINNNLSTFIVLDCTVQWSLSSLPSPLLLSPSLLSLSPHVLSLSSLFSTSFHVEWVDTIRGCYSYWTSWYWDKRGMVWTIWSLGYWWCVWTTQCSHWNMSSSTQPSCECVHQTYVAISYIITYSLLCPNSSGQSWPRQPSYPAGHLYCPSRWAFWYYWSPTNLRTKKTKKSVSGQSPPKFGRTS